jgi:hypothetical protein
MRVIGLGFFYVGIIIALISAAKVPEPHQLVSDLSWIYLGGVIIALISLFFSYHLQKQKEKEKFKQSNCSDIIGLLQGLQIEMQHLGSEIKTLDENEIIVRVNKLLDDYVLPFVAIREEIIHLLGYYKGIELLVTVAKGERLLNRMNSAACDGVVTEAYVVYVDALAAFEDAYAQVQSKK